MTAQNGKTPAMVLQEFAMKKGCAPPEYILVKSKSGTHENEFHYQVNVDHTFGYGFGRSKQVAKHDAAKKALEKLAELNLYDPSSEPAHGFDAHSHRNEPESPLNAPVNFIGNLKDKCMEFKLPYPDFREISDVGPPHCRIFTYECSMGSIVTQATANTKKQARQLAAKDMLEKIRDICPQIAEQAAEVANALTEKDQEAMFAHAELQVSVGVVPNRTVKVQDFTEVFVKIMNERELTFADFAEYFSNKCKDSLESILSMLGVPYEIKIIQQSPLYVTAVLFGVETPFTALSVGDSKELAEHNAIVEALRMLEVYMDLPMTSSSGIRYDML